MSNPQNEKTAPMNQTPNPGQWPGQMNPPAGVPPPMGYAAVPPMPNQYQVYARPPGVIPVQPQQTIFITNVREPDYLGYSIFTLLCCCLPLGIAGLIFSLKTQDANRRGDIADAQKNSRLALILDHTALGIGITSIVVSIILIIVLTTAAATVSINQFHSVQSNPWTP